MSCNLIEVEVLESGIQGLSAYEVYVQNGGELSEKEWLESLKGQDGADGYTPTVAVEGTDYKVAPKIKAVDINSDASTNFSAAPAKVETVPAEDGTTKTIDALKLTGVNAGTYAIEYEASAAWTGTYKKVYKVIVVQ